MTIDPNKLRTVLVTDCGSTTTKALLFEKTEQGWRHTYRGEAPTTVEEPVADVTVGAINAFIEVQELSGRNILRPLNTLNGQSPFVLSSNDAAQGIDVYLSTSSAGGGLQMMVMGIVGQMSTESASRAALGAGAIVMDAISIDDGREDHERIERIRHIKPDIVLITGGVEKGSRAHALELAEILLAARPSPRFGETLRLPVIYAGNSEAAQEVCDILKSIAQVSVVENVRPKLDQENLGPAREAIHDFFLTHVMSHSPGYGTLLEWTPYPIMPTPAAVGDVVLDHATRKDLQLLCVDIGGATTDVFSVFKNRDGKPIFNRTVSANLGMSYSIANVLLEAGVQGIARWLPYEIQESELRDRLRNKMIRPTSIPQTIEDLWLEQAVCREALRLSLQHHRSLAVGLSGVQQRRGIADIFNQQSSRYELVNLRDLDLVIGSGGVLSHAPSRMQAALMMLDGFALEGVTQLAVDSIFMMPHLGVLSSVHPQAALEIFEHDCLVNLGHALVPLWSGKMAEGDELARVLIDGREAALIECGKLSQLELSHGMKVNLRLEPLKRGLDLGKGAGVVIEREIEIGLCGLLLDGRGRPFNFEIDAHKRVAQQQRIFDSLGLT